jgi:hypothetical protein
MNVLITKALETGDKKIPGYMDKVLRIILNKKEEP